MMEVTDLVGAGWFFERCILFPEDFDTVSASLFSTKHNVSEGEGLLIQRECLPKKGPDILAPVHVLCCRVPTTEWIGRDVPQLTSSCVTEYLLKRAPDILTVSHVLCH